MFAHTAVTSYLPVEFREKEGEEFFNMTLKMMENEKNENAKKILLEHAIRFSFSHKNRMILAEWLSKGIALPGYQLQRVC